MALKPNILCDRIVHLEAYYSISRATWDTSNENLWWIRIPQIL